MEFLRFNFVTLNTVTVTVTQGNSFVSGGFLRIIRRWTDAAVPSSANF